MNHQELLREQIVSAIEMKRSMCDEVGGPFDLPAWLAVTANKDQKIAAIVPARDEIPDIIDEVRRNFGAIETVAFIADAFARSEGKDELQSYRRGDLRSAFESGDPSVVEGLHITVYDVRSNETAMASVLYRYGDHGQPIFEEPQFGDCGGGAVIDLIRRSTRPRRERRAWQN
jgi:hypothetical protein